MERRGVLPPAHVLYSGREGGNNHLQRHGVLPPDQLPHPRRVVTAASGQLPPVGAEGNAHDPVSVPLCGSSGCSGEVWARVRSGESGCEGRSRSRKRGDSRGGFPLILYVIIERCSPQGGGL